MSNISVRDIIILTSDYEIIYYFLPVGLSCTSGHKYLSSEWRQIFIIVLTRLFHKIPSLCDSRKKSLLSPIVSILNFFLRHFPVTGMGNLFTSAVMLFICENNDWQTKIKGKIIKMANFSSRIKFHVALLLSLELLLIMPSNVSFSRVFKYCVG